ncbi:MAG: 23S rRNA (adenine(2503)-C(2))-methyltransferase RlmN [Thermoleophilia bacterium]|nr:23S rRNA (adenine(2503)-C(2))-methyltransferase RlmN [Thermoleophilia bacterium]
MSGRPSRPSPELPATLNARDLLAIYRPDISEELVRLNAPPYRHTQLYEHLVRRPGATFIEASSLPLNLREALAARGHTTLEVRARQDSADGTTKLLFAARDGVLLESVIMRYARRSTVCVSTQVGCSLACTFCSTGAMGFIRDLTAAEIVDQVRAAMALLETEEKRVGNIVFMGMGEPLLNLDAVLVAIRVLKDPAGMDFAQRALSVSTVGIPAGIRRLARVEPQVNLALSLHAADDTLRTRLMPVNRRFPIAQVMRAVDDHFVLTHRKLFVEYLMLAGVNDQLRHAHTLATLLQGRVLTVNLIPWNPGCGDYRPSSPAAIAAFQQQLAERGVEATIRAGRGLDIAAACGQLATRTAPGRNPKPASRDRARPGERRQPQRPKPTRRRG